MSIRTKLLLCFFGLSMLTFMVGMVFYFQIKNLEKSLILTIPRSVEQLENNLEKNNFISQLAYYQMAVNRNLESFVFSNRKIMLQQYYASELMLSQLEDQVKKEDPDLWQRVEKSLQKTKNERLIVLRLIQQGNLTAAKNRLASSQYAISLQEARDALRNYSQQYGFILNESAAVAVKVAAKNTLNILRDSLNVTMVIFINAIIISVLLAFWGAGAISRSIKLLQDNIEDMSSENLNAPINPGLLNMTGELGELARSYLGLIGKLRTTTVLRDELLVEIEKRNKIEDALRQMAFNLQETNRELDQFAYIASHDLRAPLRGIENLAKWIEDDCYQLLPEKSREHFDLLKRRIRRLDALINGILEYSRIGRTNTQVEIVHINKMLPEIVDNLSPPAHIKIIVDNALPAVKANKIILMQVFLNLISNAIKYHDKTQGNIHIGCKPLDKYWEFYVADDGPGIDPQFHNKIFEIFQTLQSRDVVESTGIGLTIVKKIIEKQNGKIWVVSSLGKGTTFYFTWPKDAVN